MARKNKRFTLRVERSEPPKDRAPHLPTKADRPQKGGAYNRRKSEREWRRGER